MIGKCNSLMLICNCIVYHTYSMNGIEIDGIEKMKNMKNVHCTKWALIVSKHLWMIVILSLQMLIVQQLINIALIFV